MGFLKRPQHDPKMVAARVARLVSVVHVDEGVHQLNPGFFALERMRAAGTAKQRGESRAKLRGGRA